MRDFFKNKPFVIMIIAIVLLVVLAFVTSGERSVTWVESTVGSVVQPVQSFAAKASTSIKNFFQRVFKTTDLDREVERLQIENARLQDVEAENERLRKENEEYRELLNVLSFFPNNTYVTASVIGNSQGMWFDVFTINVGRNRGIEKGMAVVNGDGLVGKITDVGATWSKVTSIIDPSMDIYCMVDRTRDSGMVRGTLTANTDEELLELYFLPMGSDLVPGDLIVTNSIEGFEDVFPKGLHIGTVMEVLRRSEDGTSRNAIILPAVDFNHLETVMVITGLEATEAAAEDDS